MDERNPSVSWLRYLPDYQSIVCIPCRRGIQHPGLAAHLRGQHPNINTIDRKQLVSYYESNALIPSDTFRPPSQPVARILDVPFHLNGLRCTEDGCLYLCRNRGHMGRHYRDQHQWQNPYTRGGSLRQRRNATYPWQGNVRCQRLFTSGQGQGYFEIKGDPDEDKGTQTIISANYIVI